jgi:hypothetical protein
MTNSGFSGLAPPSTRPLDPLGAPRPVKIPGNRELSLQWPSKNQNFTHPSGNHVTSCVAAWNTSQYKDYVLILLFVKYVSDKYAFSTVTDQAQSASTW